MAVSSSFPIASDSDAPSSAALPPEAATIIAEETQILTTVVESIERQIQGSASRFAIENVRSRELTSSIVATRRAEDKAALASEEAVAHGLRDKAHQDIATMTKMIERPYFARVVMEEEMAGTLRTIEYKIGTAANPDCRIIDWRKAPIAKLYYEYREGDEYSEEILGKERNGRIITRNTLEIEKRTLRRIQCRLGSLVSQGGTWRLSATEARARSWSSAEGLPHILTLITPEQFSLITEDAESAVLIQGIAGSGKTTVALHRLAWLLHEDNSDLKPYQCAVVVRSRAMQAYIAKTLPSLEVHGVRVMTYAQWCALTLRRIAPHLVETASALSSGEEVRRPNNPLPQSLYRLKHSLGLLTALEKLVQSGVTFPRIDDYLVELLARPERILEHDETRLLNRELIRDAHLRAEQNRSLNLIDVADDGLLVRIAQLQGTTVTRADGTIEPYRHLVVDEVQDLSPTEIATIIAAVREPSELTLVGDSAQQTTTHPTFPGWDKLRAHPQFQSAVTHFVSLNVSFRSTLPIMRLAEQVARRDPPKSGRQGRIPIWFKTKSSQRALRASIEWVTKALERYPTALTAVLCATPQEARQMLTLLKPTFGQTIRLGDQNSFSFEEGVLVTDIAQSKGLEFTNVLLWNPSNTDLPESPQNRSLLYVAITRAEENLCIVSHSRVSDILPRFDSPLVRGYDLDADDAN